MMVKYTHVHRRLVEVGIVVALLTMAALLRAMAAFHAGIEVDEPIYQFAASYAIAHGFPSVRPAYEAPVIPFLYHPPFALLLLGAWMHLWQRSSLLTARMCSIVCSLVMLTFLYVFIRKATNSTVARVILLVLAIDPWLIFTNQAVYLENSQMIVIVFAVWTYWLADQVQTANTRAYLLRYVLAGALLGSAIIWKHIGGFLLIGIMANFMVQRRHWRGHALLLIMVMLIVGLYSWVMHARFGVLYDDATYTQIRRSLWDRYSPGLNYSPSQALAAIYARYWIFPLTIGVLVFGSLLTGVRFVQHVLGKRKGSTVLLTWALGGIIFAVCTSLKSPHYMILWLIPLYICLVIEGIELIRRYERRRTLIWTVGIAVLLCVSLWSFKMRFLNVYGDTLAQADAYINTQLPANAIIATQDYIGVDIGPQYVNIAGITQPAQLLHSPVTYVALYWSTTEPLSNTLQIVRTRCLPLATFSGFKDHVEVCKLDKSGHLAAARFVSPLLKVFQR